MTCARNLMLSSNGFLVTDVVLEFSKMRAIASWTGPTANGGSEHVLNQAEMV